MKAQEYADRWIESDWSTDVLAEILIEFTLETGELLRKRNTQTTTAGLAVVNELSDKWKSFARRSHGRVKEDGDIIAMRMQFPDLAPYI